MRIMRILTKLFIFSLLTLSLATSAYANKREPLDRIIAIVAEKAVAQSELDLIYNKFRAKIPVKQISNEDLKQQALESLIMTKIQLQTAKKFGIDIDASRLTEIISNIAKSKNKTISELKKSLEEEGISYDDFRADIKNQIIIDALQKNYIQQSVTVSKNEVYNYLQSADNAKSLGIIFKVRQYSLPLPNYANEEESEDILKAANDLVKKLNSEKLIADNFMSKYKITTKETDYQPINKFPSHFHPELLDLQIGEATSPVKASDTYRVLQLISKKLAEEGEVTKKYKIQHILIKPNDNMSNEQAKERLNTVLKELKAGKSFAELAKIYSEDPGSSTRGGNIGWITADLLDPKFAKKIEGLEINKVSDAFQSSFGWHIAIVNEVKVDDDSQKMIEEKAYSTIYERKSKEKLNSWLNELREDTFVKILDNKNA